MWVKGAIIAGGSANVQSVEKSQCGDFSKQNTRSSSIPCCLFGHILKRHYILLQRESFNCLWLYS